MQYRDLDLKFLMLNFPVKGSLPSLEKVRSGLGWALRRLCCAWPQRNCLECPERDSCTFAKLFYPYNPTAAPSSKSQEPFVLKDITQTQESSIVLWRPVINRASPIAAGTALALNSGLDKEWIRRGSVSLLLGSP